MKQLLFFIFLMFATTILAQTKDTTALPLVKYLDVIKMKGGSLYQGHIKKMTETTITIEVLGGFVLYLSQNQILSVEQRCLNCNEMTANNGFEKYRFREKGHYVNLGGGVIGGIDEFGYTFNTSVGYMLKRTLGVGGGFGFYRFGRYSWGYGDQRFIPVFVEARSYFRQKMSSPFATFKAGYGIRLKNNTEQSRWERKHIAENGGLFLNPTFGYRFGANSDINYSIDVGFLIQKSTTKYELLPNGTGTDSEKYTFQRWQLSLGVLF